MGQDPNRIKQQLEETRAQLGDDRPADDIRADIEETRANMSETAGALGHKADVKGRVTGSVAQKKNAVVGAVGSGKDTVVGSVDSLVSRVGGIVPSSEQMADGAARVGVSRQSPVGLVVAGGAAGLLAGLLIPSTRMEDERIGETAEQLKQTAKDTGSEVVQRAQQVAGDAATAASESAGQQSQELADTLQGNVKQQGTPAS